MKYSIKRFIKNTLPYGFIRYIESKRLSDWIRKLHIGNNKIDLSSKFMGKIFCIGFGKTGTTSLEHELNEFGYILGDQAIGEILSEDWAKKRTDRIVRFCKTADAFQDSPFGLPELYKELDKEFVNSKFILTIRNDGEQWYNSLLRFHGKTFSGDKESIPSENDLRNALYRYQGWVLDMKKLFWNYPEVPLYDKEYYIEQYNKHNESVKNYFRNHLNDLLVLNVAEKGAYQKLADFLGIKVDEVSNFAWKNKT